MSKDFEKIVKFNINENDEKTFNNKIDGYNKIIELIENFDFNKYQEYLDEDYMLYSNTNTLKFSELRDDEPKSCSEDKLKKITNCAVNFKNEYVSLKNEK